MRNILDHVAPKALMVRIARTDLLTTGQRDPATVANGWYFPKGIENQEAEIERTA
jgi:hypothetical protein